MIILGIDTSCDDTAIGILEIRGKNFEVKSNILSSQIKLHAKYGGVWPTLAKREHQKNLPIVYKKAIKVAKNPRIDLVAITIGPGLEPCLWEGINFAKNLAKKLKIPIIPVNHIEAHILINFLNYPLSIINHQSAIFPAICLVVSGGHTQLFLMRKIGDYKILGETRDDAAGECFDKVARLLGLSYPGGPAIEKFAKYEIRNPKYGIKLPRPMINQRNYDFSFAGLKTAVLYDFKERSLKDRKSKQYKIEMAKEVQQAVIDVLIEKTVRAAKDFKVKTIFLGGGVIANKELRNQIKKRVGKEIARVKCLIPQIEFCTDNGAMVALAGFFHQNKVMKNFDKIKAKGNLTI